MQGSQAKQSGGPVPAASSFQVRSRSFTAAVLQVEAGEAFLAALDARLKLAPHFFAGAPIVLDLSRARGFVRAEEFAPLLRELRSRKLAVIGVQNGSREQNAAAAAAGLAALPAGREPARPTLITPPPPPPPNTVLVSEPVRSGQRVRAERGDLVVVAPVSAGAELIARGNIHVYGPLRGRALAGVDGDETARIFCQSLEAELIAIAGLYRASEDLEAVWRARAQIYLEEQTLRIEVLK